MIALLLACVASDPGEAARRDAGDGRVEDVAPAPRASVEPRIPDSPLPDEDDAPEAHPDPAGFLFAHDVIHELHVAIDDDARAALAADPRADVPVAVTFSGATFEDAGLQLKGETSFRTLDAKAAFKIDFGEFVEGRTLFGVRRLTLNNMLQDPTMLRDWTGYRLHAAMGVDASRQSYARVWVNGVEYGLYSLVETPDRQLVERLWGEDADGHLYEGQGGADFEASRVGQYELRVQGTAAPWVDLDAMVDALDAAGDDGDALDALVHEAWDADELLSYLAVDLAQGNPDGYAWNHHNYLVFHHLGDDRWRMMPWSQDRTFNEALVDPLDPTLFKGRLAIACVQSAPCQDRLRKRILEVVDAWEDPAFQEAVAVNAERIAPLCEADPRRETTCRPDKLFDFFAQRGPYLRARLE